MKKYLFITGAIIVVIVIIVAISSNKTESSHETITATRSSIIQDVLVTGKVEPFQDAVLSFERSGRINRVLTTIGDEVVIGQKLAELNQADLLADLQEAQANVFVQKAKLAELESGTRPEEIQIQEAKLAGAYTAEIDAKKNLIDKLQDGFTKSDDAIRNKVDQHISNPRSSSPTINFTVANSSLKAGIESDRQIIEILLLDWSSSLPLLTEAGDLNVALIIANDNLNIIKQFLEENTLLLNGISVNANLTQAEIDTYKANVSTARTNTNTAVINLTAAQEKLSDAKNTVLITEHELTLKKAGATPQEIATQKAYVKQAEAQVIGTQAEILKTRLISPINGIITKQDATAGEFVAQNIHLITIIAKDIFKIETNIPEVDIPKISLNDIAEVTLDAYGDSVFFKATIIAIDPAETIIEGVPTYKTTLRFIKSDERIKTGMTANIEIVTDMRTEVIAIPARSIRQIDGLKIVRKLVGEIIEEIEVITGLRGSDGTIEILSGISEGDEIITFFNEE